MTQPIALNKLQLSAANVRKSGERQIEQLAADIAARGLLTNLVVTAVRKPRGHFAVIAGGRRLAALRSLAEAGQIAGDTPVACKVLEGDDAVLTETSLAENFQRLAMTPADECRAFQHFLGQDGDVEAVAKRFGVTCRFVEGRLRLAKLAEPVFAALAEGRMTLDMAKAYASTDDQDKQARIFEQYGTAGYITPDQIRRVIAGNSLRAGDPIAKLVGEAAYTAAGGRIERELFGEEGDRWVDQEIAQHLAGQLMEAEAKRVGEEQRLGWVRPIATNHTWGAASDLHRVQLAPEPLNGAEQARADAITERMEAIGESMKNEALDDEAIQALEAEHDGLQDEWDELHTRPCTLPEELRGQVGGFLTLQADGSMTLDTAYYSEEPLRTGATDANASDEGRQAGSGDAADAPAGTKPLSARLQDELCVQRRDILAAALLADPGLALDYALFALVDGHRYGRIGTTIRAGRPDDPVSASDLPVTPARIAIEEAREALDASWCGIADDVERFDAFRALPDDAKAAWAAQVTAASLEAKAGYSHALCPLHRRLGELLEVDVASWWRPTAANYFDRVPKATTLIAFGEVGGPVLASRYAASKKGEVAAAAEKLFAGEAITEAETQAAALAWLPDAMRFSVRVPTPTEPEGGARNVGGSEASTTSEAPDEPGYAGIDHTPDDTIDYRDDDESCELLEPAE